MICIECKEEVKKGKIDHKCERCNNFMCIFCHENLWSEYIMTLYGLDIAKMALQRTYIANVCCSACYTLAFINGVEERNIIHHPSYLYQFGYKKRKNAT